jgi:S-adenosylmethionine:tRNA-ribosyltransferase-isomerase (queuine synthetase)
VRVDDVAQHRMHAERYAAPIETVEAVEATSEPYSRNV